MNVKVGDLRLAALIENPGERERKKAICGTPNCIAPEVLFDTANRHSRETKEVKDIYQTNPRQRIRIPHRTTSRLSISSLIQGILTPDPSQRPTVRETVDVQLFTQGSVPAFIPTLAHDSPPDFPHMTHSASSPAYNGFIGARDIAARLHGHLWAQEAAKDLGGARGQPHAPAPQGRHADCDGALPPLPPARVVQQKEFRNAVQPGSPISAPLSSANRCWCPPFDEETSSGGWRSRFIVQMAPVREEAGELSEQLDRLEEDKAQEYVSGEEGDDVQEGAPRKGREPLKPAAKLVSSREKEARAREQEWEEAEAGERKTKEQERRGGRELQQAPGPSSLKPPVASSWKPVVRDAAVGTRCTEAKHFGCGCSDFDACVRREGGWKVFWSSMKREDVPEERVFIVSWVDYCNKYGLGYALTDGSVSVHFNGTSSLVLSADKEHFDHITSRRHRTIYMRNSHTSTFYPEELKSKVYLLKPFKKCIVEWLYGEYDYTFKHTERAKGIEWVQKCLRMKHVIVFKLRHHVLQVPNSYNHLELILPSGGLLITHIDKSYNLTRWTLHDVMAISLTPTSDASEDERKFNQKLADKLQYCKEVLISIKTARGLLPPSRGKKRAREGKEKEREDDLAFASSVLFN
ncbi:hypothetical protein BKA70DRAFT_1427019 [Coprinopsis sp. MPI-PUGE-AT-0042]|nr:hypothetical protein BKA70DRAFT_1427019 [Coprinopsis sp. MPI-PUGE-AT-0042]